MFNTNFFDYLFPGDKLSAFLLAQKTHHTWMAALESQLEPVNVMRGEILVKGNHVPEGLFFLEKGALKGYELIDSRQKVHFLWEGPAIVCDLAHFFYETNSNIYIEGVQEASLLRIERKAINNMLSEYPASFLFLQSIFLKYISYSEEQYLKNRKFSPWERFQHLFLNRRHIEQVFSKTDIASYLDMGRSTYNAFHLRLFG